jgi:hypothetical protein
MDSGSNENGVPPSLQSIVATAQSTMDELRNSVKLVNLRGLDRLIDSDEVKQMFAQDLIRVVQKQMIDMEELLSSHRASTGAQSSSVINTNDIEAASARLQALHGHLNQVLTDPTFTIPEDLSELMTATLATALNLPTTADKTGEDAANSVAVKPSASGLASTESEVPPGQRYELVTLRKIGYSICSALKPEDCPPELR